MKILLISILILVSQFSHAGDVLSKIKLDHKLTHDELINLMGAQTKKLTEYLLSLPENQKNVKILVEYRVSSHTPLTSFGGRWDKFEFTRSLIVRSALGSQSFHTMVYFEGNGSWLFQALNGNLQRETMLVQELQKTFPNYNAAEYSIKFSTDDDATNLSSEPYLLPSSAITDTAGITIRAPFTRANYYHGPTIHFVW